jgi:hypothetical protein
MKKIYPVYTSIENKPNTICQNLDEIVFEYPFFNEGVTETTRLEAKERYDLDALELEKIENEEESLELKGWIFHVSHCGSTLLSKILSQIQNVRVVSETEAINGLLLSKQLYAIPDEAIKEQLRKMVRCYQQKTDGKEYLIFKMTSWNVYFLKLMVEVFPEVKWIFLDRETESLVRSLMKKDGGFITWWDHPVDVIRKHFIESGKEIKDKEAYLREIIRGHRSSAISQKGSENLFLEYPQFIERYQEIFDYFELKPTKEELNNIKEMMNYDSKSTNNVLWKPH